MDSTTTVLVDPCFSDNKNGLHVLTAIYNLL